MKVKTMNLFIVGVDDPVISTLYQYLRGKFGNSLNIFNFSSLKICLEKIDRHTRLVLLGSRYNEKDEAEMISIVHSFNSKTSLVKIVSNSDAGEAIDQIRKDESDPEFNLKRPNGIARLLTSVKILGKRLLKKGVNQDQVAFIVGACAGLATLLYLIVKTIGELPKV